MIIISDKFIKSVPVELKDKLIDKITYFQDMLNQANQQLRKLPAGFWVRKIEGTEIYKFRLNNCDRILFSYAENDCYYLDDKKTERLIILLEYCKHDKQIIKARNLDLGKVHQTKGALLDIDFNPIESCLEEDKEYVSSFEKGVYNDLEGFVVTDETLLELIKKNDSNLIYYLTNEQRKCIEVQGFPVIITGTAGSGKTTIALHKLIWCQFNNKKAGYFTENRYLKETIELNYHSFLKSSDNSVVEFFIFDEIYKKNTNMSSRNVIKYDDFKKWIETNKKILKILKKNDIDIATFWTEIKGIIKGYVGLECAYLHLQDGYITKEEYVKVPIQYSMINTSKREVLYSLFQKYQMWLDKNQYLDENDLARNFINNGLKNFSKYDYIVVDEVQDLTEIQLYLLSLLVKDPCNVLFSGDFNQVINPNFFRFGRVKNILYAKNLDTKEFHLKKNYRSAEQIVILINELTNMRQKKIGYDKYDIIAKPFRKGGAVINLSGQQHCLNYVLDLIKNKHYSAIVTVDELDKHKLINLSPENKHRIFTIFEIKGLEYKNILCFNLLSRYKKFWINIDQNKQVTNRHRIIFNQLYVALSRARDNLFIFEESILNNQLENIFSSEILNCTLNTELDKYFDLESTNQDWINEIDKLEKNEKIQQAENTKKFTLYNEDVLKELENGLSKKDKDVTLVQLIKQEENEIESFLNEGYKYFQKRQFLKAAKVYETVIDLDSTNAVAYHQLGNCYSYSYAAFSEKIHYYFDKAIELNPNNYLAYCDQAAVYMATKDFNNAIKRLKDAIEVNPKLGTAYFMLGNVYCRLGKSTYSNTIIENYTKALQYDTYVWDSNSRFWKEVKRLSSEDTEVGIINETLNSLKPYIKNIGIEGQPTYQEFLCLLTPIVNEVVTELFKPEKQWEIASILYETIGIFTDSVSKEEAIMNIEKCYKLTLDIIRQYIKDGSFPSYDDLCDLSLRIRTDVWEGRLNKFKVDDYYLKDKSLLDNEIYINLKYYHVMMNFLFKISESGLNEKVYAYDDKLIEEMFNHLFKEYAMDLFNEQVLLINIIMCTT